MPPVQWFKDLKRASIRGGGGGRREVRVSQKVQFHILYLRIAPASPPERNEETSDLRRNLSSDDLLEGSRRL